MTAAGIFFTHRLAADPASLPPPGRGVGRPGHLALRLQPRRVPAPRGTVRLRRPRRRAGRPLPRDGEQRRRPGRLPRHALFPVLRACAPTTSGSASTTWTSPAGGATCSRPFADNDADLLTTTLMYREQPPDGRAGARPRRRLGPGGPDGARAQPADAGLARPRQRVPDAMADERWAGHYEFTLPTGALTAGARVEDLGGEGRSSRPAAGQRLRRQVAGRHRDRPHLRLPAGAAALLPRGAGAVRPGRAGLPPGEAGRPGLDLGLEEQAEGRGGEADDTGNAVARAASRCRRRFSRRLR